MNRPRPCGCKGQRSCLICEEQYNIQPQYSTDSNERVYEYCNVCETAWECINGNLNKHPHHETTSMPFPGVYIQYDFLDDIEKEKLLEGINTEPWSLSQSGRRKQNYGPRCNFKKTKIQKREFNGFPKFSKFVHDKFKTCSFLSDFQVIEQCVLEYDPARGASIDPHIDDCWIWGERIVTVNVLGDTFLTLGKYKGDRKRYNLHWLDRYSCDLKYKLDETSAAVEHNNVKVRIFMPEKSLIVLYGKARYDWEHFIPRDDIQNYRLCIAYREFSPPYLNGEFKNIGQDIQDVAKNFW